MTCSTQSRIFALVLICHHSSKQDGPTFCNENRREGACRIVFCRLDMTGTLKELCYKLSESRPWFYLIAHTLSEQTPEESSDAVEVCCGLVCHHHFLDCSCPALNLSFFPSFCPLTDHNRSQSAESHEKDSCSSRNIRKKRSHPWIEMIIDKHTGIDAGAGAGAAWTL